MNRLGTAESQGIRMRYAVFGSGEKNLVILPGLSLKPVTDSAEAVAASYESFTDEYTVWLFDVRSNIPEGYSIEEMASDTVTIMKSLGIENADFFTASMGGMMVQYIAANSPEMTGRIVMASSMCRNNEMSEKVIANWKALAEQGRTDSLIESMIEDIYSKATLEAYREILIAANSGATEKQLEDFLKETDAILAFDSTEKLRSIKCPVLVLGSEGDSTLGVEASRELAANIADAQLYIYPECYGHCVYDEAPDFKEHLHAFYGTQRAAH